MRNNFKYNLVYVTSFPLHELGCKGMHFYQMQENVNKNLYVLIAQLLWYLQSLSRKAENTLCFITASAISTSSEASALFSSFAMSINHVLGL